MRENEVFDECFDDRKDGDDFDRGHCAGIFAGDGNCGQSEDGKGDENGCDGVVEDVKLEPLAVGGRREGDIDKPEEPTPKDHSEGSDDAMDLLPGEHLV